VPRATAELATKQSRQSVFRNTDTTFKFVTHKLCHNAYKKIAQCLQSTVVMNKILTLTKGNIKFNRVVEIWYSKWKT